MKNSLAHPIAAGSRLDASLAANVIVRVLLVSGDIQTVDTLSYFLEKLAMRVEVCSDSASAAGRLCQAKFEAVIVDFNSIAGALELVKKTRRLTSHKASVMLAILRGDDEMPGAFRAGASFVLVRPLTPASVIRTLRLANPHMIREKRRTFRCPVSTTVYVSSASRAEFVATSANISEGGMALLNAPALQVAERISLRLTLPGAQFVMKVSADVCWSDHTGKAGVEFVAVSRSLKEQLVSWLSSYLENHLQEEAVAMR
jgi:CheY-like chemotaxis protein